MYAQARARRSEIQAVQYAQARARRSERARGQPGLHAFYWLMQFIPVNRLLVQVV